MQPKLHMQCNLINVAGDFCLQLHFCTSRGSSGSTEPWSELVCPGQQTI